MKKSQIILAVSILCVVLLYVYLIDGIYSITLEDAKKNHQLQQLQMAKMVSEGVGFFLEHLIKDMELITNNQQMFQYSNFLQKDFIDHFRSNYDTSIVLSVIIIDYRNKVMLTSGKKLPDWANGKLNDLIPAFEHEPGTYNFLLSPVLPDNPDDTLSVKSFLVILPIDSSELGIKKSVRYVAYLVNFNSLVDDFIAPLNLKSNDFVWIIDGEGKLIYHPRHKEMLFKSLYEVKDECLDCHRSFDDQIKILKSDKASFGEYWVQGDEPSKIFAYVPLKLENQRWYIAISTLLPDVTDELKGKFKLFFILGIVILFTILGFVFIIYYLNLKRIKSEEERKNLEKIQEYQEQLNHSSRLASIGELVDSVAHEINTPLGVISAQTDSLLLQEDKRNEIEEELHAIKRQTKRINDYTRSLLNFSKRFTFNAERIEVIELLDDSIFLLQPKFRERKIKIIKLYPETKHFIEGDRRQLEQVFINILNNAVDSISNQGEIIIRVKTNDFNSNANEVENNEYITISISDNGIGIEKENLDKIFDPFFSTKENSGTGLGLSITKSILQRHKGRIEVQSEKNKGTTFVIYIPGKINNLK